MFITLWTNYLNQELTLSTELTLFSVNHSLQTLINYCSIISLIVTTLNYIYVLNIYLLNMVGECQ